MKATLGTISHGTLRTQDLLDSFAAELDNLTKDESEDNRTGACVVDPNWREKYRKLVIEAKAWPSDDHGELFDPEEAAELVSELQDALGDFAPPYCYFGAHEGDGSDFGFWPHHDAIEELPRVEDADEAKKLGEDCAAVNDHGNVTVYSGQGNVILELV